MKQSAVLFSGWTLLTLSLAAVPATGPVTQPSFFPSSTDRDARRIVFVCDASWSIRVNYPFVLDQLNSELESLVGAQSFDIVYSTQKDPLVFSPEIVSLSDKSRLNAIKWLKAVPDNTEGTEIVPALKTALDLKPDIIYVVTDCRLDADGTVPAQVHDLNVHVGTKLNITWVADDSGNFGTQNVLKTISDQNGGVFTALRIVSAPIAGLTPLGGSLFVVTPGQRKLDRIAFVCDASGSMLNKWDSFRNQLEKALDSLQPSASFGLFFMQDRDYAAPSPKLRRATPAFILTAEQWMKEKVRPHGETNPISAIEAAFAQRPDIIFVLTDGDFPDNRAVLKRTAELNKDHPVQINTIAFASQTDTDTDYLTLLQRISSLTGGVYQHVKVSGLRQ